MKQILEKGPKVCLCRACHGTGRTVDGENTLVVCAQCEGSGRVTVSVKAEYDIRPYRKNTK